MHQTVVKQKEDADTAIRGNLPYPKLQNKTDESGKAIIFNYVYVKKQ